jgi:hypothetical protein
MDDMSQFTEAHIFWAITYLEFLGLLICLSDSMMITWMVDVWTLDLAC